MKRVGSLWPQVILFANILLAFKKAAKGKGLKPAVLEFVKDFETNILTIQKSLIDKSYRPETYITFIIHEPKERMISAAHFKDRVVHHCLINIIGPIFESTFIQQSYANQLGKGTHRAIRDVQQAMRINKYVFKCDIRKYFPAIDHAILKQLVRRKIKDPEVLWLVDLIIDYSNPQEFVLDYFPGDDLFTPLERRKGLPIGNLTSQFFANVYLTGLDHYIKEVLRCRYYARYVDDMVVLENDKKKLWDICHCIDHYLESLRLKLHPHKNQIRPVSRGVTFLGQVIYPHKRFLRKQNVVRFMKRIHKFQEQYIQHQKSWQ